MYCRYQFAFTSHENKIYPNANWKHATPEGKNHDNIIEGLIDIVGKTLTEILLKRDFSFVAFGYEARNKFVATENKHDYLYFSNFKMVLHNKVIIEQV